MKVLLFIISLSFISIFNAQSNDSLNVRQSAVDVFIDCPNTNCPQDYIRQELSWVNYVRDRKLAQLHLLISSQSTAGNGREYLLDFIGLKDYESINFQLNYISNSTQTEDEIREGIIATTKLGLMPFIAKTDLAKDFEIEYKFTEELKEEKVEDKWKSWVFDVSSSGYFNGQETNQSLSLYNNASAKK